MKGFLVATFPKGSETFVFREFVGLARMGVEVSGAAFALGVNGEALRDACGGAVPHVHYVSAASELVACVRWMAYLPMLVRLNARLGPAGESAKTRLRRMTRSGAIATWCLRNHVNHLHCHWPYATRIGCLVHKLIGVSYSASIHAHEVAHDAEHFPEVFQSIEFAAFCNQAAMEFLLRRLPKLARAKAHLIYHGVDLSRFAPKRIPTVPPLRVVSAGRLTATKGFDRLIRGCAKGREAGLALELEVYGDGEGLGRLREMAAECGFEPRRAFPGWVSQAEIPRCFEEAHVFAFMADVSYHDGLPNVVVEAMACGRPVITSPLPAAPEAITSGVEGFILDGPEDYMGFVRACKGLLDDPYLLTSMGHAARLRAMRDFDENPQLARLAALFRGKT